MSKIKLSSEALKRRNECLKLLRSKYKKNETKYDNDFWKQHRKNNENKKVQECKA